MTTPIPILPVAVGALVLAAIVAKKKRDAAGGDGTPDEIGNTGTMTPDRQAIYEQTLKSDNPEAMHTMANVFQSQGLTAQANVIRKRAGLLTLPASTKLAREQVFHRAMASTNKSAVTKIAGEFMKQGCTSTAQALYKYAEGLP